MKVVINTDYGGFGLSQKAYRRLVELGVPEGPYIPEKWDEATEKYLPEPRNEGIIFNTHPRDKDKGYWGGWFLDRHDPRLVQAVEELGSEANGDCAELEVVEIPDGTDYEISEYDGLESIHETHQSWP